MDSPAGDPVLQAKRKEAMQKVRESQAAAKEAMSNQQRYVKEKDEPKKDEGTEKKPTGMAAIMQAKLKENLKKQIAAKVLEAKKSRLTKQADYEQAKKDFMNKIPKGQKLK